MGKSERGRQHVGFGASIGKRRFIIRTREIPGGFRYVGMEIFTSPKLKSGGGGGGGKRFG